MTSSTRPSTADIRKRTRQEILDECKNQVRYLKRHWEETKVRAACNGMCISSVDDEMVRTEHGRVHMWDGDLRYVSLAAIHGNIGAETRFDKDGY